LPTTVKGLAFDSEVLWASTPDDYWRLGLDGVLRDRISVLYNPPDTYWTSDALTSDGNHLWGHLPSTVDSAGVFYNRSRLIEFTRAGVVTQISDVRHRIGGLAHDATGLWSLDDQTLVHLDTSGVALERIPIAVPDLVDIESDGLHFWGIGWFVDFLYEIDRQGAVLRVYDLPPDAVAGVPSALAFDGTSLWFARANFSRQSTLFKIQVEP